MKTSRMKTSPRPLVALMALVILGACRGAIKPTETPRPAEPAAAGQTSSALAVNAQSSFISPAAAAISKTAQPTREAIPSCPVTPPNGQSPPGVSDFNYGNEAGTLFTTLWPEGTVIFARNGAGFVLPDGSLAMKWPWYRAGITGTLAIGGRRLDAPASTPRAETAGDYGETGFQPVSLIFPTEGCWEVSGRAGEAELTFVTRVVKVPFGFINLKQLPEGLISMRRDLSDLPEAMREIYDFSGGGELVLESSQSAQEDNAAFPTPAQQEVVEVNGHPGACVQGAFDKEQQWQNEADAGALEWTADGARYRISHKGLGLRCEDLLSFLGSPP